MPLLSTGTILKIWMEGPKWRAVGMEVLNQHPIALSLSCINDKSQGLGSMHLNYQQQCTYQSEGWGRGIPSRCGAFDFFKCIPSEQFPFPGTPDLEPKLGQIRSNSLYLRDQKIWSQFECARGWGWKNTSNLPFLLLDPAPSGLTFTDTA